MSGLSREDQVRADMTADLRCALCGATWPLETARMAHGPGYVCEDGYVCATRANARRSGRPALALTPPVTPEP